MSTFQENLMNELYHRLGFSSTSFTPGKRIKSGSNGLIVSLDSDNLFNFKGSYDGSTNGTITSPEIGDFYIVSDSGTLNTTYIVNKNDIIFYTGTSWFNFGCGRIGNSWYNVSNDTNILSFKCYFVDTSTNIVNLTLPPNPQIGDIITLNDLANSFETNNCVIVRNGKLISGLAEDLILDSNNMTIEIVFSGDTYGWKITSITI